jgi:excisionase family DNA binding protein
MTTNGIKRTAEGRIIENGITNPHDALTRETVPLMRAAELAGVSRRTVYNWLADGKIQGCRTAGGSIRIFTDTLFTDIGLLPKKGNGWT